MDTWFTASLRASPRSSSRLVSSSLRFRRTRPFSSLSLLTLAAIFLLAFIVRILAGTNAGAISLVLLSLYPGFTSSSHGALALFCLSALMTLLCARDYTADRKHTVALCLALAVPVVLGLDLAAVLPPSLGRHRCCLRCCCATFRLTQIDRIERS